MPLTAVLLLLSACAAIRPDQLDCPGEVEAAGVVARFGGPAIAFTNVGARLSLHGAPLVLEPTAANVEALRAMTVKLIDGAGKGLDTGKGSDILVHPLNAVIWLADDLKASGITLKPGDLLSLGSFLWLLPPCAGLRVRAIYEGLPGDPAVAVSYR